MTAQRRKLRFTALAALALVAVPILSLPAQAGDALDQARSAGYLGERPDGYLGLVQPDAPDSMKALMKEYNRKRRAKYRELAEKNGTSVEAVQAIAAQKIREQLQAGWYYLGASGQWTQK